VTEKLVHSRGLCFLAQSKFLFQLFGKILSEKKIWTRRFKFWNLKKTEKLPWVGIH
jgi:hypothetical protein